MFTFKSVLMPADQLVNIIDMTGVILVLCRQCWWYQSITVDMQTVAEPA
ncbi:unnamed protein product [Brassica rapa subsp. narinosa]